MHPARQSDAKKLLTLRQAADKLAVSIDAFFAWNKNNYHRFISWVGNEFYEDAFIKQYLKSQIKDSLTFTVKPPSFKFKRPSKRAGIIATAIFTVLLLTVFTQQYRIKFLIEKMQAQYQRQGTQEKTVLAAQTSKMKLMGTIIFKLPVTMKDKVSLTNDLHVAGESVFTGNITAPNVLYGIKGGEHVTISNEASQIPTISVDLNGTVSSFQGKEGDIKLEAGTDIAIDGLTISDTSTLSTITSRGGCAGCIKDADVANNITIEAGGNISAEAIKKGIIKPNVGGTGVTSYTQGDLLYAEGANTLANLAIGTQNGQILQIANGLPSWSPIALNAAGSGPTNSGATMIGVYGNLGNSSATNLQQVLQDLDASITSVGVSPFSVATDGTYGTYIRPLNVASHFVVGGSGTPDNSTLFFNTTTANLGLGTNNTGSGGLDGTVTLYSSGNGITDTTLTTNASGALLIPNNNVGIGTNPVALDADGNPLKLEVAGSIGPDQNGVYDLGTPTKQYRNLYLTGQTTSGGNITIANNSPTIIFSDTDVGENAFILNVDASTLTLTNNTTGQNALTVSPNGDLSFAGGSSATGCTITNSTGSLSCSGTGTFGSTLSATSLALTDATNQVTLGTAGATTIISAVAQTAPRTITIPALSASDTFVFANEAATLTNKTIGSTGLIFSGGATDIASAANEDLTVLASGTGQIILNDTVQLGFLPGAQPGATSLCRDGATNQIIQCPANASNTTLQLAYDSGNTITTTTGRNIDFTLGSGLGTSTSLTLTNAGTANAFILNDTNAATNTALEVQSGGVSKLTINENGNLVTAGTLTSQATTNQFVLGTTNTTTISSLAPAASRIATLPALTASDTFVFANQSQTLTNKSLVGSSTFFQDATDTTKQVVFDVSQIATGTTRTLTIPDGDGALCLTTGNCAGTGGVVGGNGNQNRIAKFTVTGSNIGDSNLSDTGTLITALSGLSIGDQTGTDTLSLLRLSNATSGTTKQNSNLLTLQGAYWTGATSSNVGFTIQNVVTNNSPPEYQLSFQNNTGTEIANLTSTGNLNLSGTIASATGIASSGTITFSGLTNTGPVYTTSGGVLASENHLNVTRGGTGVDGSTATNGSLLIGNGTGYSLAALTGTANQINVTNGSGTITLTTPQDIATTSSPTFTALTLTGSTDVTTGTNQDLTLSPNGTGQIILSNTTVLSALPAAPISATTLCRDDTTHEVVQCPANAAGVSLQEAYESGNTLDAADAFGNIALTLAAGSSRQLSLTNAGTASSAFVLNDTNAANHTALEVQSGGTQTLTINENGALATSGTITSAGALTVSAGGAALTGLVTLNGNTSVSGANTFTVGTGATSLGGTLGVSGLATFNGQSTFSPSGTTGVTINTDADSTVVIAGLQTAAGNKLCLDGSNAIVLCNAQGGSLQQAYTEGNTITTTDARPLAFTLADTATDSNFTITNQGTANAFVLNDTNAATNTALEVQSGGVSKLTINENGTLTTSGNIVTNGTGAITSAGLLTASNGFTQTTGALNLTATSGGLNLTGLSGSTISTGINNLLIAANNLTTTATGINATAIGTTTPSTAAFTTLATNSTVTMTNLLTNTGTALCVDQSDRIIQCSIGSGTGTLQSTYDNGNTITTRTGRNIDLNLYDETTNSGTATSLNLTNAGTATALRINDTNAGNGTIFDIQSGGSSTLKVSEAGVLSLIGNNTSDITTLTGGSDLTIKPAASTTAPTGGAVSLIAGSTTAGTATGGSVTINAGTGTAANGTIAIGTLASGNTINIGTNNITPDLIAIGSSTDSTTIAGALTANNLSTNNITVTGGTINGTAIGATGRSTGAFTTLAANSTVTIANLSTAAGTSLCTDGSNNVVSCGLGSSAATLQSAYDNGNTIATTNGKNVSVSLSSGLGTPTSFAVTNAGTASSFILNDTNGATNTALEIQSGGIAKLTITENGVLTTSGTISTSGNLVTTGTGTITSAGALTVQSGGASLTGGINNNTGGITGTGAIAGATTITASGAITGDTLNALTSLQTNGTDRIDAIGNLTNIGTIASGAITTTGTLTFSGVTTDITTGTNEDLTVNANGAGLIVLNDTVRIPILGTTGATVLCRNGTNQLADCDPASFGVTLQRAYDTGNTIDTTSGRDIAVTLSSGLNTSFNLTNAGSSNALVINDTNSGTGGTALAIQSGGSSTLTISELGTLATSGNIATTGTGTITSAGTDCPIRRCLTYRRA